MVEIGIGIGIGIGNEIGRGQEIGHLTEIVSVMRGRARDAMVTLVIVVGMSVVEMIRLVLVPPRGRKASAFHYLRLSIGLSGY
jgi:precorrin-3B methylase